MDMGYETESASERDYDSGNTSDDSCTNDSEDEDHGDHESIFEPPTFPDELRVSDDVPVIHASRFRKTAYK